MPQDLPLALSALKLRYLPGVGSTVPQTVSVQAAREGVQKPHSRVGVSKPRSIKIIACASAGKV